MIIHCSISIKFYEQIFICKWLTVLKLRNKKEVILGEIVLEIMVRNLLNQAYFNGHYHFTISIELHNTIDFRFKNSFWIRTITKNGFWKRDRLYGFKDFVIVKQRDPASKYLLLKGNHRVVDSHALKDKIRNCTIVFITKFL